MKTANFKINNDPMVNQYTYVLIRMLRLKFQPGDSVSIKIALENKDPQVRLEAAQQIVKRLSKKRNKK